jgi:hypothetical protein
MTNNSTAAALYRAFCRIRATYGIGLAEAVAMWRRMPSEARQTWMAPA